MPKAAKTAKAAKSAKATAKTAVKATVKPTAQPVAAQWTGTALPVVRLDGAEAGSIEVGDEFLTARVNTALLHQLVNMYRASQRAGTADTKRRSEVSGGGKKPWKQKHTGRARAGSTRSPLWRHGGIIFGPHPRDFGYQVPAKMRRAGLLEAFRAKARDGEITIIDVLAADKPSTKVFGSTKLFKDLTKATLVILERQETNVVRSLRNIRWVELTDAKSVTVWDLLNHRRVIMARAAWPIIEERCRDHNNA